MKTYITTLLFIPLALLLSACASTSANELAPVSKIPPSVAKEGTLANAKLVEDATKALFDGLQIAESERLQIKIIKFVIQQPVGPAGKKAWRETWVLMRAEKAGGQFIVTFREDGAGSANFQFEGLG